MWDDDPCDGITLARACKGRLSASKCLPHSTCGSHWITKNSLPLNRIIVRVAGFAVFVLLSAADAVADCDVYAGRTIEVTITVPLSSAPPEGDRFFLVNRPLLVDRVGRVQADSHTVLGSELRAIFCIDNSDLHKGGLTVEVGPKRLFIPDKALVRHLPTNAVRPRFSARLSQTVMLDWIAPVGLKLGTPDSSGRQVVTVELIAAPEAKRDMHL